MVTPHYLKRGDTIAIVSTARKINTSEIQHAITLLEGWGLDVILGNSINAEKNQFAGDDFLRATDFQQQLDNPKINAIWCARGGYGTVRIIDKLDFSKFIKQPKWLIGYSDVTVLHSHIHNLEIETLHATMPIDLSNLPNTLGLSDAALTSFKNVLFGKDIDYSTLSSNYNKSGTGEGQLVGGNLSMLYSVCGSPSAIKTNGKILFIEDLDEYVYHIDRMLQNLKRNGLFENLSGLIVGGMTKMHDNSIPFGKTVEEIILAICAEYDFPITFNFPAGHVNDNRPLIFGREAHFKVDRNSVTLSF